MTQPDYSRICIVGLGYIGLPTAAMFASRKIEVIGVDVNPATVEKINGGKAHISEPDLEMVVHAAVDQGYLRASAAPEPADAFLIAVPTPFVGDEHQPDLSYIAEAARAIAVVLAPGNLVVLESTSPVGATEALAGWLADARPDLSFPTTHGNQSEIRVAHCPERVLPGRIMQELVANDRIIGGLSPRCSEEAVRLYRTFVQGDCILTDARTAEMAKLTENSFRDVNIAFANELSIICDRLAIDVWELISLANRHPRVNILQPGPGVGGHCIAVDPWFIASKTPEEARLIRAAREVNNSKPAWVLTKVREAVRRHLDRNPDQAAADVTIACYGIAFKPDIGDLRESPAKEIAEWLTDQHEGSVLILEPNVSALPPSLQGATLLDAADGISAAVHVMLVDHWQFKELPRPAGELVDVRGLWR